MSENNYLTDDENKRKVLTESISKSFYNGALPYAFYRLIDTCLIEYKFETEVVYQLFSVCFDQNTHRSYTVIENLAKSWHEKGYTTASSLKKYLWQNEQTKKITKLCGQLMRKRLNGLDMERIISWVENYDVSEELVKQAFKVNEFRSNLTLKNIDDTLAKWHKNGVTTIEEAVKFCEKEYQINLQKKKDREQANEQQNSEVISIQPLWHRCDKQQPVKNGPYLVTQKRTLADGETITVEKRWFRDGAWPLTQYEKSVGAKIDVLAWAILPAPYVPN